MIQIVRPDQFAQLYINEEIIDLQQNPTWNHLLGLEQNEIDYAHVVYIWESTKYPPLEVLTYKLSNALFSPTYLTDSDNFSKIIEKYYKIRLVDFDFWGLLFLTTTYIPLKGKINFLQIIDDYIDSEEEDAIGRIFSCSFGKLVYHFQLEKLFKIAKGETTIRFCKEFRQKYNLKQYKEIEKDMQLLLPNGQTLEEVITERRIGDFVYKPHWAGTGKLMDFFKLLGKVE